MKLTGEDIGKIMRKAYREGYDNAHAETHLDRAAIIEECARMAERECYDYDDSVKVAAAIRALKDKP